MLESAAQVSQSFLLHKIQAEKTKVPYIVIKTKSYLCIINNQNKTVNTRLLGENMVNEFDLELLGSKDPVIWRRFLISDECTFMEFHYALQILFGWQNCHMFCFKPERKRGSWLIADKRYEEPFDRNDIINDAREVMLKDIFSPSRKVFFYNYDYGDNWHVKITLLHRHRKAYKGVRMSCRDGFGKAPPEDCGGLRGFQNLKNFFAGEPMEDPGVDYRYWLGLRDYETWDPYEFSILAVDSDLMRLNRLLVEEGLYAFQKNR